MLWFAICKQGPSKRKKNKKYEIRNSNERKWKKKKDARNESCKMRILINQSKTFWIQKRSSCEWFCVNLITPPIWDVNISYEYRTRHTTQCFICISTFTHILPIFLCLFGWTAPQRPSSANKRTSNGMNILSGSIQVAYIELVNSFLFMPHSPSTTAAVQSF